jgi:hypothetical protein
MRKSKANVLINTRACLIVQPSPLYTHHRLCDELHSPLGGGKLLVLAHRRGLAPVDLADGAALLEAKGGAVLEIDVDGGVVFAVVGSHHGCGLAEGSLAGCEDGCDGVGEGDGLLGGGLFRARVRVAVRERGGGGDAEIEDLARDGDGFAEAEGVGGRVGVLLGHGPRLGFAKGEGFGRVAVVVGMVGVV